MKRITIIILAVVLSAINLFAQTTFELTYDNGSKDEGASVIELSDGYLMCGSTMDDDNGDYDVFVTRVSETGDVVWTEIYSDISVGDDHASYINGTSDGYYIITGTTEDPGAGDDDVFVLKISDDGTELWNEIYDGGTQDDDGANYITEIEGGTYLICGYSYDGDFSDMWLFEITDDGAFEGENFYGLNGNDEATCVIEVGDGTMVIIGQSFDDVNDDLDGVLIKTDDEGEEDWAYYTTGTADEIFNDFIIDDNGDYLIVGAEEDELNGDYDLLLEHVSEDGSTLLYSYTFDYDGGDDEAYRIYSDGIDFFIAGYVEDVDNGDVDAYLALIDVSTGDIIGDVLYGDIYDDEFYDFDITSDNGFICIGYQEVDESGNTDVYLVKTDDNGDVLTEITLLQSNDVNIKIYPNPVSDFLKIETSLDNITSYTIESLNGQTIQQGKVNSTIDVSSLSKGVYFIKINTNDNLFVKKFIKLN